MESGIYKLINTINKKFYIGSAVDLYHRKHSHLSQLRRNVHPNEHLQRSYNKHKDFNFEVIEYCGKENLINREQYYIDTLKPVYNIRKIAKSNLGLKQSEESKQKRSLALKGRKRPQEVINRIIATKLERGQTEKELLKKSNKVINIKTGEIYNSLKELCEKFNLTYQTIGDRLRGTTINDTDFRYLEDQYNQKVTKNFKTKSIKVYSLDNQELFKFDSIRGCERELTKLGYKVQSGGIVRTCKQEQPHHCNMIFRYDNSK